MGVSGEAQFGFCSLFLRLELGIKGAGGLRGLNLGTGEGKSFR